MRDWIFDPLTPLKYGVILADPPWRYELYSKRGEHKSAQAQYKTMTTDEICALPVRELASRYCVLFMWSTWPQLPDAIRVMDAWGFRYKTGGTWVKRTKHDKVSFGTGYIMRSACEPFLIGTIGQPDYSGTQRSQRNLFNGKVRGHSRKPDEPYRFLERMLPGAWCVELFARQSWPGWDAWGNETTKFKARAAEGQDAAMADARRSAAEGLAHSASTQVDTRPLRRADRKKPTTNAAAQPS